MIATQISDLPVDNPLVYPQQDRLGYAPFAKYLAESICQMTFPEGFVIAVYGGWGSGKSTFINFVTYYLQQQSEQEKPIIIRFNPWLFTGHQDITRSFFDQLQNTLSQSACMPQGLKQRIANFAKFLGETPLPYSEAGKAVATIFDDKQKETSDLKEEVETTLLQERQSRLVIAIEDIDRLSANDIIKLFRLLKAIYNFNNVVYLLAFDKSIVHKTLVKSSNLPEEEYLDKIVQASFSLPKPDKISLRRLLFAKLNGIFNDQDKQVFNQNYWCDVYYKGLTQVSQLKVNF